MNLWGFQPIDIMQGDNEGDPDGITGEELWTALHESRQNLQMSFLFLLSKAASGAVPCSEVAEYSRLRTQQLELEKKALAEMERAGITTGIKEPSIIPDLDQCKSGETSIWLQPQTAGQTLSGAIRDYNALQDYYLRMEQQTSRGQGELGVPWVAILVIAGVVIFALDNITKHVFVDPGKLAIQAHKNVVDSYLTLLKAGLSHDQAIQVIGKANEAMTLKPPFPLGISAWQGVFIALGVGLLLGVGGWYFFARTNTGSRLIGKVRRQP